MPHKDHPHMDVLQNIEASVIQVFRENPELTDYEVDSAYQALYQSYRDEKRGREEKIPTNPRAAEVYQTVRAMCEWRLGREPFIDEKGIEIQIPLGELEADDIAACFKDLRKSLRLWTKEGGRQGYLNYIAQFL